MEFKTDEEKSEDIKKWLRDNGSSLVTGLLFGLAVLFGGKAWFEYQDRQAEQASILYAQLSAAALQGEEQAASSQHERLLKDHAGSTYAVLAALQMAKLHADKGNLVAAQGQLDWAVEHASIEPLKTIAQLRLVRVLSAQQEYQQAESTLNAIKVSEPFEALYAELQGDLAMAQGEFAAAHQAYEEALAKLPETTPARTYLEAKRDDAVRVKGDAAS